MQKILLLIVLNFSILSASQVGIVHGLDPYGDGFLSLRSKPRGVEIGRLYNNNKVIILNKRGQWYKVKDIASYKKGWVFGKWLRIKDTYKRKKISKKEKGSKCINYVVTIRQLNVRDNPGKHSRISSTVRRGEKVCIYYFSGKWGRSDYGWLSGKYLSPLNQYVPSEVRVETPNTKIPIEATISLSTGKDGLDKSALEQIGALILKDKQDSYDSDTLGLHILKTDYSSKYKKVKNDEFELNDAKEWALNEFKEKVNTVDPITKNRDYSFSREVTLGKYDFKAERFPISDAINISFREYIPGKNKLVSGAKISFESLNNDINFIEIKKNEAKKLLKSRKSSNGHVNRHLTARYIYNIVEYEETRHIGSEIKYSGWPLDLKLVAKWKSVEFIDEQNGLTLKKVVIDHTDQTNFNIVTEVDAFTNKNNTSDLESKKVQLEKVDQKVIEDVSEEDDFKMPDEE